MPETILDVLRAHSFNRPFTFLFYTHSDPSEVSNFYLMFAVPALIAQGHQ